MSDIDHARALLGMAYYDLKALQHMRDPNAFAEGIFGFHAQQAIEKSLKAWIAAVGGKYPLIHDIEELISVLRTLGHGDENLDVYVDYNPFAVQFRYAEFDYAEEPLDREDTIVKIQVLYDKVKGVIEEIEGQG